MQELYSKNSTAAKQSHLNYHVYLLFGFVSKNVPVLGLSNIEPRRHYNYNSL